VFEPAIILVMGVIVGTVVLSMLMAIFSINEIGF
jgi:general secretion pathway protein F